MHTHSVIKKRVSLSWHSWIIGIVLLLFGLFSAYDYVMSMLYGEDFYRASGMTEAQIEYYLNFPVWAEFAWTVSVWGMLSAVVALLMSRRMAYLFFAISLAGSLFYIVYIFILSEGKEAMGVIWPAPLVISAITAAMIYYSKSLPTIKPKELL